jgi:hypothetical protein
MILTDSFQKIIKNYLLLFFVRGSFIKKKMLRKNVTKKCYEKSVKKKVLRVTKMVHPGKGLSK